MRTVLVTGTSSGIGRATALRLARNAWRVFAGVRNDEDGADLVQEEGATGALSAVLLDVTSEQHRSDAVARIEKEAGALHALVNNAGSVTAGPLECLNVDDIRRDIETNLISAIALTQQCLPAIRKSGGRVVNVGSAQDTLTPPYFGGYTLSKWGMRGYHQALRLELRPWDIECVLIVPGGVKTRIWDAVPAMLTDLKNISGNADALYRPLAQAMQTTSNSFADSGVEADVVAQAIEQALVTRRPKAEVFVGADARFLMRPLGALPTRLRESIMSRLFKLP